jgi:mono/diheme cytochrome c family protein
MRRAAGLLLSLLAWACDDAGGAVRLGGELVASERVADGHRLYDRYCAPCHGERGDGLGPVSAFLWPPARDFRTAEFKFAPAAEGELPADEDIAEVVRRGLAGTAMLAWDLPESELGPIVDAIKSFSPPGRGFRDRSRRQGRPPLPPDPFAPGDPAARAEGERLYHAVFQCDQCHPTYAAEADLAAWGARPRLIDPREPVPRWSANYRSVLLPPDFRRHPMRFARSTADFYRIIAHGMQGPMPAYGHLGAERIWAVAHYTAWLVGQRH